MNILELCLSPGLGGLELYVYRSAEALSHKHKVLAVLNHNGKLTDHFKQYTSIPTEHLNYSSGYLPIKNAKQLARIIDDNNIDIMHMHWGNDLALAALAKRFSKRKPALVYTRQMKITRSKDDIYHNFLYSQMDLMLTITRLLESEAKQFINRFEDRITTLYYGVDAPAHILDETMISTMRLEAGFSKDDFIVGLLGRLEHGKGQHLLIEALAQCKQDGIEARGLIVGHEMNPGYREKLQQMAEQAGIQNNVVFMDFVKEPQKLMQLCDCILLASFEETFGLVLPEAMRSGVAVIGSNKGGVPEIIEHEKTGLLFVSEDANSLHQQIKRLYRNEEFKIQLANNGKASADERFNTEKHFEQLEQHFTNLLQGD